MVLITYKRKLSAPPITTLARKSSVLHKVA